MSICERCDNSDRSADGYCLILSLARQQAAKDLGNCENAKVEGNVGLFDNGLFFKEDSYENVGA